MKVVGVIGAGTMGIGIAQVAVQNNKQVIIIEANEEVLNKSKINLFKTFEKLVEKQKLTKEQVDFYRDTMIFTTEYRSLKDADLVIEAIVEKLDVKHSVFKNLEEIVSEKCILASNTSSLSIASISSVLKNPSRFLGIHFFNPAPLMALVEVIPGVQTSLEVTELAKNEILSWNKKSSFSKRYPRFHCKSCCKTILRRSITYL